jgi:hypothetical protein
MSTTAIIAVPSLSAVIAATLPTAAAAPARFPTPQCPGTGHERH